MASACVNNIGVPPESFLNCPSAAFPAYGWLSPSISFGRDYTDEEKNIFASTAAAKPHVAENASEASDLFKDVGDFEFHLNDPVTMLPTDKLFSDLHSLRWKFTFLFYLYLYKLQDESVVVAQGKKLVVDLGNLMSVQVIVEGSMNSSNPYFSSGWRRGFIGGFILDMEVHMIAGLRMLVGCELTSVSALTSHVDVSLPPPDNISSTFLLENGCPGVFVMSVSTRSPKIFWRVVGLNGTVQVERSSVDGRHGYMVSSYNAEGKCTSSFYSFCGVTEELKAFIHDISEVSLKKVSNHQAEPRLSYVEGVRDVAVLEAMLESGSKQGVMLPVRRV